MQVALPDFNAPATLILDSENPPSDEQFATFCEANRDLKIERNTRGEIVIVPPAGGASDYRNADAISQLFSWSRESGKGTGFGATALFLLEDGSALSPDAAWISTERLSGLTPKERAGFLAVCPEFVIEVLSPSDRLVTAQKKMRAWIANGAQLGWLIDGDAMKVYVYRTSGEMEVVTGEYIDGEGPVAGFRMDLTSIWEGL
jgi:Uma2 family endonuclease